MANQDHDVLVYSSQGELYRVPVEKDPKALNVGSYGKPPEKLTMVDPGYRKVDGIANYDNAGRGAGFAVLPNKPDPQSSQMSCYLINPQNFQTTTPWTATEWSSAEDKHDDGIGIDLSKWQSDAFEFLLAAPQGQVFFVQKGAGQPPTIAGPIDLRREGEIWTQLRNGLVVGTVRYVGCPGGARVVPLFNVASVPSP